MPFLMEMTGTNYTYFKLRHATDDNKECYIGSTKNMRNQISVHKSACKNSKYKKIKLYNYIRENGGFDEWKYDILETKLCETPYERYAHMKTLIKLHNATLHTYNKGKIKS